MRDLLAERLWQARDLRYLSLHELAHRSGVSKTTIHAIETGIKNPSTRVLYQLALALDVPVVDLLHEPAG